MSGFVATQVVIDFETLYYLVAREYPFHRTLHTLVGSTATGIVVAVLLVGLRLMGSRYVDERALPRKVVSVVRSEASTAAIGVGCIVGGASHTLLDGILHSDVRPLGPWRAGNPLLGFVSAGDLHLLCVAAGLVGLLVLGVWLWFLARAG